MGKVTKAKPHLTEDQVLAKIKSTVGYWRVQGWQVIWNATVDPRPASQIATHVGLAQQTVHNLISQYNRFGPQALEKRGRGGRHHCYLSLEEEASFLEPFITRAAKGEIATAAEVQAALEERLGHSVHKTTVYRMLKRHQWRKITPRPSHVHADPQQREAFKKTSRPGETDCS